jgi:hypothetical protein
MNPPQSSAIDALTARAAIADTVLRYCRGVDRRDWDLVRSAYHHDAYDDHGRYKGGVEGLLEFVRARHDLIDQSMHFVGNMLIELDGDFATVETYCLAFERSFSAESPGGSAGEVRGAGPQVMVMLRYADRFERRTGAWKIAQRIVIYESGPTVVGDSPPFGVGATQAKRSRDDASWAVFGLGERRSQ